MKILKNHFALLATVTCCGMLSSCVIEEVPYQDVAYDSPPPQMVAVAPQQVIAPSTSSATSTQVIVNNNNTFAPSMPAPAPAAPAVASNSGAHYMAPPPVNMSNSGAHYVTPPPPPVVSNSGAHYITPPPPAAPVAVANNGSFPLHQPLVAFNKNGAHF